MKIKCQSGFFTFQESRSGEAADFMGLWNIDLVPFDDKFTFKELENPEEYSIEGSLYLGAMATKTFSGKPWEIFEANELVFDFLSGQVVNKSTITIPVRLDKAGSFYLSDGLIVPGSIYNNKKINSYSCWFNFDKRRFRYSEVTFD